MSEEKVRMHFSGEATVQLSQTIDIPKRIWDELKTDSDREVDDYLSEAADWAKAEIDVYGADFSECCIVDADDKIIEHLRDD